PKIAVLDETDSGLDIDALRVVAEGINRFRAEPDHGVMLITHYTRILRYVTPDFVHVFVGGRIVEEGGPELAETLETEGYERWVKAGAAAALPSAAPASARTSRSWTRRSAAGSRWPTWTAPTPRRSRGRSSTR